VVPMLRLFHMTCSGLLTFILLLLSAALWMRTKQGPYYEHDTAPDPNSSPMRAVDVTESVWQLELSAQLKIALLSIVALITAAYAVRRQPNGQTDRPECRCITRS
jgi:hypothetical protein